MGSLGYLHHFHPGLFSKATFIIEIATTFISLVVVSTKNAPSGARFKIPAPVLIIMRIQY